MSPTTSHQNQGVLNTLGSGPFDKFERDVQSRRVEGATLATIAGWTLYLFVVLDAFLNSGGIGSLSMLIAGSTFSPGGIPRQSITGICLIISIVQLLILGGAGAFLAASPWRRWLRAALRETWPGLILVQLLGARHDGTRPTVNRAVAMALTRDLLLLLFAGAFLLRAAVSVLSLNPPLGGILTLIALVSSVGLAKIIIAITGKARRDSASAAALLAGCLVPLIASAYAGSTIQVLHASPTALTEFVAYQMGVLAIAITGIWFVQLGSVSDNELLILELGGAPTGIWQEFLDLSAGAFKPFKFQVRSNGEKVILLSLPVEAATHYQVHSTLDRHDPGNARWVLFNLSALESSSGPIRLTRQGQTRYLEAHIDFRVASAVPEQYLARLRASRVYIPVEDVANSQSYFFDGGSLIAQIHQELDLAISAELDRMVQAAKFGSSSVTTLSAVAGEMRLRVSQLKQAFDVQVAAFRASAGTGLRLDREAEIRDHLLGSLKEVAPMMMNVRDAYADASRLDQNIAATQARLQTEIRQRVESVMQRLHSASRSPAAGGPHTLRIRDFLQLNVQSVDVHLTPEAQALHGEITTLYKEAEAHWGQAASQLGAIAKEHGDVARTQLAMILDGRTPSPIRNWGLGLLAGASSGGKEHSGTPGAGPIPVFQRTIPLANPQTFDLERPKPNAGARPTQGQIPIFKRSDRSAEPGSADSTSPGFPD